MNARGQDCCFTPGSGVFAGGSIATNMFGRVYQDPIDKWTSAISIVDNSLTTRSVVSDKMISLAATTFVDNLSAKITAPSHEQMVNKQKVVSEDLDAILKVIGVEQNRDNKVFSCRFHGRMPGST
eukprot:4719632-Heterocapsa_arctica.AAC.1